MTPIAVITDDVRREAARLAAALLRFEEVATHPTLGNTPPGVLEVGRDAYIFIPFLHRIPREEIETFLVSLPSPALLAPTNSRGMIAVMLLHELSGERRAGFQHELENAAAALDDLASQLGLSATSRILLEFDEESHVFSFAAVREWTQQFPVRVGWSMGKLDGEDRAEGRLMLRRSDGRRFAGRSDMIGAVRGAA